jgi:hypothetical protein
MQVQSLDILSTVPGVHQGSSVVLLTGRLRQTEDHPDICGVLNAEVGSLPTYLRTKVLDVLQKAGLHHIWNR